MIVPGVEIPDLNEVVAEEPLPPDPTPESVLRGCAVLADARTTRQLGGLYVIGTFDKSVTILRQQARAFNLAWALHKTEGLSGAVVAVVGGGAAATTAAVAASLCGAAVWVFEQSGEWLGVQSNARHRYVHPNLYEWPHSSAGSEHADLPAMSWTAGRASDIAQHLRDEFTRIAQLQNISLNTRSCVKGIAPDGRGGWRVLLSERARSPEISFTHVLMAVGYGTEREVKGMRTVRYWEPDNVELRGLSDRSVSRVLVSGAGDGGLADAIRSASMDTHGELFMEVMQNPECIELARGMRKVDQARDRASEVLNGVTDPYKALLPSIKKAVAAVGLYDRCHAGRQVYLLTKGPNPYGLETALINRLIVRCLEGLRIVLPTRGTLNKIEDKREYLIPSIREGDTLTDVRFQLAFVRHGPDPATLDGRLPDIDGKPMTKACARIASADAQRERETHVRLTASARSLYAGLLHR